MQERQNMRDRSVDIKEKKRRLCNTVTDLDVIKVCLLEREKKREKERKTDGLQQQR